MAAKQPRYTDSYSHPDSQRLNNTAEGLSPHDTSPDPLHTYSFDPHTSPSLNWAGKSESTPFTVPTLAIHRHERINPLKILYAVRSESARASSRQGWLPFIQSDEQRLLSRLQALDAYHHPENWTNRMIAGDSLVIMNSLLQREHMAGTVQTCYIDPPYGIKYGSNFQPFVNKKDVKDRSDDDLTTEPEMIRAFRDTWQLGIHSYLTYLRNRLYLVRELLKDEGSVFVQISDENVHLVRCLLDEVFGAENFVTMIKFRKTGSMWANLMASTTDYLVWYAKDKKRVKYHQLYVERKTGDSSLDMYSYVELDDGTVRKATDEEMNSKEFLSTHRNVQYTSLVSPRASSKITEPMIFEGEKFYITHGCWKTSQEGIDNLAKAGRISKNGKTLRYKRYLDDFAPMKLGDLWDDTGGATDMRYVVQTSTKVIQRCILMTSDPADLVLDITCGSGTTAYVAEQWGRRWITCDTSRIAIAIARQRLLTANFDWYTLADKDGRLSGGFEYESVPHITLKSIANNEPSAREILYDKPEKDSGKTRLAGPFTVESLPAPVVISPEDAAELSPDEGARHDDWIEQLLATGIRAKGGERIRFARVEAMTGTRWLNAKAWTDEETPKSALVCFADTSSLMDSKRVKLAMDELKYQERPEFLVYAAFQFNPESQDLIANMNLPGIRVLQVKMNDDLVTADLRKNVKTDESFWLVGQPDIELVKTGSKGSKNYRVKVLGFDYYNIKTDKVESGNSDKIAMWMLDPDYDGAVFNPSQVFFPLGGWEKLARTLQAEIDLELIEAYSGTESLEFELEDGRQIAVKIIDDRGIESMRVLKAGDAE